MQSMEEKKKARLELVLTDVNDFNDRFPDSKLKKQVLDYQALANNSIKKLDYE
jgi:outer membrane protein assembly factor BamD